MAKSGFVPAWMRLSGSDKINVTNRPEIDSSSSPSNSFAFRRSLSRERTPFSSFDSTKHENQSETNKAQRRLHSVSSSIPDQTSKSVGFDQDFPSLKSNSKTLSIDQQKPPSIWNNAASKLRSSTADSFKIHQTTRFSPASPSRSSSKKDRFLSTVNNNSTINQNRTPVLDFHANFIKQTKSTDRRSDFLNSLKNHSINKPGEQISMDSKNKKMEKNTEKFEQRAKLSKTVVLLLSVPESPEEKEFLKRMGWNESDEIDYEITDQDKEDYERRLRFSTRVEHNTNALMLALRRRTLPSLNIDDLIQSEKCSIISDDDSLDD